MKVLRVWVAVLLAFVLPVRGGMAATLLCAEGVGQAAVRAVATAVTASNDHHRHDHHPAHGHQSASAEHGTASHPMAASQHHADDGTDAKPTCHICASGCFATPLASAPPTLAEPLLSATVSFPALTAPVASFEPEGLERPPRAI